MPTPWVFQGSYTGGEDNVDDENGNLPPFCNRFSFAFAQQKQFKMSS